MGRRKSAAYLQKQLQYAQQRQTYTAPTREPGSAVTTRAKTPLRYQLMSLGGTTPVYYTVRASITSLEFFGSIEGTELGLSTPQGDTRPPRGFKPAKIHAVKTNEKGVVTTAKPSGRPYLKYTNASSAGQSSYSSPICSPQGIPGVVALTKSIYTEKSQTLGPYGRLYTTPEYYIVLD